MPISEIVVWSAMLGGLLTLAALALADVLDSRTRSATRNLLFVLVTGTGCIVISGLPGALFPQLPERLVMVAKASLGPLASAMALYFLGGWLGGIRQDAMVHRLTAWAAVALLLAAIGLAVVAAQVPPERYRPVLITTAVINMAPVLLAFLAVIRAARLGDLLARKMLLAIVCLAAMTSGLYLRSLDVPLGLGAWVFTAAITIVYFLIATVLGLLRNRHNRELARLSRLQQGADPATGLPTGSALLAQVEHTFWRTALLGGKCTVVCLYVSNLYELADSAGPGVEPQILVTLAARIRRAAGFRCVVGLYHPRCFVVVMMAADAHQPPVNETVARLRDAVSLPLTVVNEKKVRQLFHPRLGLGMVTIDPDGASPMDVLNDAERQALAKVLMPARPAESEIETAPMPLG